jgi:hypothetical protein
VRVCHITMISTVWPWLYGSPLLWESVTFLTYTHASTPRATAALLSPSMLLPPSQRYWPSLNVAWDSLQWRPYRRPKYGVVQIYKEVIVVNGRHYRFKCRRVSYNGQRAKTWTRLALAGLAQRLSQPKWVRTISGSARWPLQDSRLCYRPVPVTEPRYAKLQPTIPSPAANTHFSALAFLGT